MRLRIAPVSLALVAALIAGCGGVRAIIPQQSTVMDVRNKMGMPTDVRFGANGDELWEYATGPMGTETYLVRIGPDGTVKETVELLTTERFDTIVPGRTSKAEVRRLLGRPSDIAYFSGEAAWEWPVRVGPSPARFVVRFDRANVVNRKYLLIEPSSGDGRDDKGESGNK